MKIPKVAMNQIKDVVVAMMPYEIGYVCQTKQSRLLSDVFEKIIVNEPDFEEWAGFVQFLSKKIDETEKMQHSIDNIVADLATTIEEYQNEE